MHPSSGSIASVFVSETNGVLGVYAWVLRCAVGCGLVGWWRDKRPRRRVGKSRDYLPACLLLLCAARFCGRMSWEGDRKDVICEIQPSSGVGVMAVVVLTGVRRRWVDGSLLK